MPNEALFSSKAQTFGLGQTIWADKGPDYLGHRQGDLMEPRNLPRTPYLWPRWSGPFEAFGVFLANLSAPILV